MKKRGPLTFFLAFIFCGLTARSSDIEKVIGDNDMVAVSADGDNIPLKYRGLIDAFGLLSMGCTATHIGNGYVLTAGHCFFAFQTPILDQECSTTTVAWGLRQNQPAYLTSRCDRVIYAHVKDGYDFAILRVSPIPPVAIAPDLHRRAAIGDTLTVFSHPNNMTLRWSRLCGVERLQHAELPLQTIQHKCDTNSGSSGATLINAISLKVVGIHDGGLDGFRWDDRQDPQSPQVTGMNYGTFILSSPLAEILRSLGF